MDVHRVHMAQMRTDHRLVRFAESVEGVAFLAMVLFQISPALLGCSCILPHRPPDNIIFGNINENDAFYH